MYGTGARVQRTGSRNSWEPLGTVAGLAVRIEPSRGCPLVIPAHGADVDLGTETWTQQGR